MAVSAFHLSLTSLAHFLRPIDSEPFIGPFQMRRGLMRASANENECEDLSPQLIVLEAYVVYFYGVFNGNLDLLLNIQMGKYALISLAPP